MERSAIISEKRPEELKNDIGGSSTKAYAIKSQPPFSRVTQKVEKTRVTHVTKSDSGHVEFTLLTKTEKKN